MKKWRRMALAACLAAGLLTMGMAAEALAETAGPGGQLVKTEDGRTVRLMSFFHQYYHFISNILTV